MIDLVFISLAIAGAGIPVQAAQELREPALQPVVLEVAANIGEADEQALEAQVRDQVSQQLSGLDIEVAARGQLQLIVVIGWRDEARTTYAVTVVLAHDGEVLARRQRSCPQCSTAQLFGTIKRSVAAVSPAVPEVRQPSPQEPSPVPLQGQTGDENPRRLTGLGWAGVGLAGVGTAAAIAGAVLWGKGKVSTTLSPPGSALLKVEVRNYRRPGIALVASGASVLAAGAAMVVVNLRRNWRTNWRTPRVVVAPTGTQHSVGVVVRARF